MLRFVVLFLLAADCLSSDMNTDDHWKKFKVAFKKNYHSDEHEKASKAEFESRVKTILKHNLEADLGLHKSRMEVNRFTDMTKEEFEKTKLGVVMPKNFTRKHPPPSDHAPAASLPANFDWRDYGVITPVRSQKCRDCWSYAVSGAVEAADAIKNSKLREFSQQQLVDCSPETDCQGGWPDDAYKYIMQDGIESLTCYPSIGKQTPCHYNKNCVQTKITSYYDLPKGDEEALKKAVYNHGPVTVCIYASDKLSGHKSGVFYDDCNNFDTNHAVLVVGYGTDEDEGDYWIIKNSWGDWWAEKGYFRLARNDGNMCRVADYAAYPVI